MDHMYRGIIMDYSINSYTFKDMSLPRYSSYDTVVSHM